MGADLKTLPIGCEIGSSKDNSCLKMNLIYKILVFINNHRYQIMDKLEDKSEDESDNRINVYEIENDGN